MDAKTNGAMPAMPVIGAPGSREDYSGLSKREAFAMAAMQGLASRDGGNPESNCAPDIHAAVMYADALLAALSQEPQA